MFLLEKAYDYDLLHLRYKVLFEMLVGKVVVSMSRWLASDAPFGRKVLTVLHHALTESPYFAWNQYMTRESCMPTN